MDPHRPEDALEHYRNGYLRLKDALHDRATGLPAYALLADELRALLDGRRHIGVIHLEPSNIDLVESLYGWQVFDQTMATWARALRGLRCGELPESVLLAAGSVPADRFVIFVPEGAGGGEIAQEELGALAAAVKVALDRALDEEQSPALAPAVVVRAGYALLDENPFYRFERRLHAAVEEARRLPERRAARRDRAWGEDLRRVIRESRIRTVWQPVVDLASGAVFGFEALSRGPADSMFEMPRAMFALSSRVGASADLDRLCRETAMREGAGVAPAKKVFVNVLAETLADAAASGGALENLAATAGRDPRDVVIEVSERAVAGQAAPCAAVCAELRSLGFGLAIDDAGTARDGAAILDRIRPDYVKVDPTLVRGIDGSLLKQEIFATVVGLGGAIGASVVAVGVETAGEAGVLASLGARYGQGYHFAGPAPREKWAT